MNTADARSFPDDSGDLEDPGMVLSRAFEATTGLDQSALDLLRSVADRTAFVSEIEALPPAFAKFVTDIVSAMAAALLPAEPKDDDTANWRDTTPMK